jgi:hypothetical protein
VKTGDPLPDYDFSKGVRGKYARRYKERPSLCHTVTTCFGLLYLLIFASNWLSVLGTPQITEMPGFWPESIVIGLILAAAGLFLMRELLRQYRLRRNWKSS